MKVVNTMLPLQEVVLAQMYVEERIAQAAREQLLREAERVQRAQREKVALKARVGRTLVTVGQRLEAAGAA
jgi:homoserine kinase